MPSYSIFEIPSIGIPNVAANGATVSIPGFPSTSAGSFAAAGSPFGYTPRRPIADHA